MSKYIPGNQKHLTLENRTYIEHELPKGTSFKTLLRFSATLLCSRWNIARVYVYNIPYSVASQKKSPQRAQTK